MELLNFVPYIAEVPKSAANTVSESIEVIWPIPNTTMLVGSTTVVFPPDSVTRTPDVASSVIVTSTKARSVLSWFEPAT